jgi:hypothetical protein
LARASRLGLLLPLVLLGACSDEALSFHGVFIPVGYGQAEILDADLVDHDQDDDTDILVATGVDFRYLQWDQDQHVDATLGTGLGKLHPADAMHPDGDDYILVRGETLSRLSYSGIGSWAEEAGPVPKTAPRAPKTLELDLDGDGRPDRVHLIDRSVRIERGLGPDSWLDVTDQVGANGLDLPSPGRRLCAGDLDGDGDTDLLIVGGGLYALLNSGGRFPDSPSPR